MFICSESYNDQIEMHSKNTSNGDNRSQGFNEKKKFRGPYSSNVLNKVIVNAITGVEYPWTVGSYGENYLWKVMNTTHFEPKLYFYDSPEQYEEYRRVKINPESKMAWHNFQKKINHDGYGFI